MSTEVKLLAASAGQLEADAQHPLYLALGVAHGVLGDDAAGCLAASAGLGVVQAAGKLAHHHHVHAFQHACLQGAGVGQPGVDLDRADVGEDAHVGADVQQALLRAHGGVGVVPLGAADGAEEHGVVVARHGAHLVGEGDAVLVDGDAADVAVGQVEAVSEGAADGLEGADALAGDLGADAVAAHDCDVELQGVHPHPSPPPEGREFCLRENGQQYTGLGVGGVGADV